MCYCQFPEEISIPLIDTISTPTKIGKRRWMSWFPPHPTPIPPRITASRRITCSPSIMTDALHVPVHEPEAVKKKAARCTNFSEFEDVGFSKAWLYISENPVVGAEQKGEDFYRHVTVAYNAKYRPGNREVRKSESIRKRIALINKQYVRFSSCVMRVHRAKPTGTNMEDILKMARRSIRIAAVHFLVDSVLAPLHSFFARSSCLPHRLLQLSPKNGTSNTKAALKSSIVISRIVAEVVAHESLVAFLMSTVTLPARPGREPP
eukprot:IDg4058t1